MRLEVKQFVASRRGLVWDVLTTWERQSAWMSDAKAVHVLTPERAGVGVVIRCPTNLFGITVQDLMRVTGWEEGRYLEIVHFGRVITGVGGFELEDWSEGTLVRWWEEIDPPLGMVGDRGASLLVRPFLRRLFSRSLRNLARIVERDAAAS